nr:hypothetical protein [Pseudomonas sp. UBA6718]
MRDIKKTELRNVVFVTAHNSGGLNEETQREIDAFDPSTYRHFLTIALEKREHADRTGEDGGGINSAVYLRKAIDNLEYILSH